MKKIVLSLLSLTLVCQIFAAKKQTVSDPIAMVIGSDTITLSDFDYLYKKNMQQQSAALSLDQYVDMFVNYRLKVLAAKAAGEDKTETYLEDMKKYASELAAPYMRCSQVDDSLVLVNYSHYLVDSEVSHITIPVKTANRSEAQQRRLLDSIRTCAMAGEDFNALAARFSQDRTNSERKGYLGFITGGMLPYEFESAASETPIGEVSAPVRSVLGLHIVKVHSRRPAVGKVKARHILKMTHSLPDGKIALKRRQIDSLLNELNAGADFAQMASAESDDNTKTSGGQLPWIGSGRTFPDFEKALFSLQPGQISQVVTSPAGFHIIKCEERRPVEPLDSMRSDFLHAIQNGPRGQFAINRAIDQYAPTIGAAVNAKTAKVVDAALSGADSADAKLRAKLARKEAFHIGKTKISVAQILEAITDSLTTPDLFREAYNRELLSRYRSMVSDHMMATLPARQPAYRHLLQEYSDGMLLFEISNKRVWDRSATDTEGLQRIFDANPRKYSWDKPHFKGYVVNAKTDSIADAAVEFLAQADFADDQYSTELRKRFGNVVKVEKVITGQGESAVIDHLVFGADAPDLSKARWKSFRTFAGQVLNQPSSALDVKGQVSLDYQQQLESQWLEELRHQYPVQIYHEVIDTLR